MSPRRFPRIVLVASLAAAASLGASDRPFQGTANGEWRYWGGDEASTRYSPLDPIDAENFKDLEVVWRWKAANYGPAVDHVYRATPLYVKGSSIPSRDRGGPFSASIPRPARRSGCGA